MIDRYEITKIGHISNGIEGNDEYLKVRDLEQDIDKHHVFDTIMPLYYRDCSHPGGYFCKNLRVIPDPVLRDQCIAIIQHRYDV